jgi:hypothetical protein
MNDAQHQFLSLFGRAPFRLSVEQTAWVLNCQPHDVPILVAARLLKPLGQPRQNSRKVFATEEVLALGRDPVWLGRITNALQRHWQQKHVAQGRGANARNGARRPAAELSIAPLATR